MKKQNVEDFIQKNLIQIVEDRNKAVNAFLQRVTVEPVGFLADKIRWGECVDQDLSARYAARILASLAAKPSASTEVLRSYVEAFEGHLLNDTYRAASTNVFSNAVEATERAIESDFYKRLKGYVTMLDAAAKEDAEIEREGKLGYIRTTYTEIAAAAEKALMDHLDAATVAQRTSLLRQARKIMKQAGAKPDKNPHMTLLVNTDNNTVAGYFEGGKRMMAGVDYAKAAEAA